MQQDLEILRHSTAHLLAHAVKELFPQVRLAIGPAIEDGFYYDFSCEKRFTEEDLSVIEAKMHELAASDFPIEKKLLNRDEAIKFFSQNGENYKVELIKDLPPQEEISVFKQGDFVDLCRGPHVASTGELKFFKLTKVSGSYWRGDAKNDVLQRIYGTAWGNAKELEDYLTRIEEAKKRDHRFIGKKLDLFHWQEEAPGITFWHPDGWTIFQEVRRYLTQKARGFGYQEVCTPIILDKTLWEKSGHWDKYQENMFITSSENHTFALKPMNCPGQIQIFKQGLKSYRDLPIRYSEFGFLHRNECSGALHGLFRVRNFVTDDGHIFCTEDQIKNEALTFIDQLLSVYADFGFKEVAMKLSTRPAKRIGADAVWDQAENALVDALSSKKVEWQVAEGEGAFYGPKVDFYLRDSLGRSWQCGTLQVDFFMPERLNAYYIAEDNSKKQPVMLHRAILGSLERFIGILLEETAGNLPVWLAPWQVVVMNITDKQRKYVEDVSRKLNDFGLRVKSDLRNEKISFKIRELSLQRVPYLAIVGDREMESGMVAVRNRDGKDLGAMTVSDFAALVQKDILIKCGSGI